VTEISVRCHVRDAGPAADLIARFERLRDRPCSWLLDSALAGGRLGRFSFAGCDPWAVARARGRQLELEVRRAVHPAIAPGSWRRTGDPFAWLRELVPAAAAPAGAEPPRAAAELPFVGGAVGYFGYELAAQLEPGQLGALGRLAAPAGPEARSAAGGLALPDLAFLLVDALLAFDHARGRLWLCGLGFAADPAAAPRAAAARVDALARELAAPAPPPAPPRAPDCAPAGGRPVGADHDAASYAALVERIRERIAAGDLYQACLTQRLAVPFAGEAWPLYLRLRRENPAPFAAWLSLPEGCVLSSSPERFLRVDRQGRVEARPIKGTRATGASAAEAEHSRRALQRSAKDRAENVMIVDLYRNDLGRVCRTGSVRVPELFAIERYAGLQQMVSTVTGRLRADRDRLDLVRAAFPPGSMTGAPKLAAMRLLAGLEGVRRGAYAGALGYLDARGGMDLSVVIRTLLVSNGFAHVHVGGGVVADSDPRAEHQESMDKARPLLAALEAALPASRREPAPPRAPGGPARGLAPAVPEP
jgi:aminodeoxychorismate synthase component I